MSTRAEPANRLRQSADETMTIISSGGYQTTAGANVRLAEKIALAVAGTHLYLLAGDPLPAGAERIDGGRPQDCRPSHAPARVNIVVEPIGIADCRERIAIWRRGAE